MKAIRKLNIFLLIVAIICTIVFVVIQAKEDKYGDYDKKIDVVITDVSVNDNKGTIYFSVTNSGTAEVSYIDLDIRITDSSNQSKYVTQNISCSFYYLESSGSENLEASFYTTNTTSWLIGKTKNSLDLDYKINSVTFSNGNTYSNKNASFESNTQGNNSPGNHTHNYSIEKSDQQSHWLECTCGKKNNIESHSGGTATCAKKAVCTTCQQPYGNYAAHNYSIEKSDQQSHWLECTCGKKNNIESHSGGTATCAKKAVCEVCEEEYGEFSHVFEGGKCMVCNASEGLRYTLINNNAEYEVSGIGTCSATYVVIPSTYNGKPVTSIGNHAFSNCHSLTSIEIPNSVTSIGSLAFWRCDSLQYNLQNGLKYLGNSTNKYLYLAGVENTAITTAKIDSNCRLIGYRAFYNRSSLTSIVIGDNVTSIGEEAFSYCSSLTNIIVDENNATYKSIDGNLYSKDGKTLIQYARGKSATSFTIPSSVTSIGDYAFSGYSSLTSIEIPNSVTSIGYRAFYYCDSLTSIEIPNSVTSIGYGAFSYCSSLTSIEIPDSVTSIGSDAFYHCSSLTSVVIGDSVTSIGVAAFWYCYSLTSIKYRGTASQWSAITKGEYWNYDTGNYTITYNYKGE